MIIGKTGIEIRCQFFCADFSAGFLGASRYRVYKVFADEISKKVNLYKKDSLTAEFIVIIIALYR